MVDFIKLEQLMVTTFIRWQKILHFLLTSLNVVNVLTISKPEEREDEKLECGKSGSKMSTCA